MFASQSQSNEISDGNDVAGPEEGNSNFGLRATQEAVFFNPTQTGDTGNFLQGRNTLLSTDSVGAMTFQPGSFDSGNVVYISVPSSLGGPAQANPRFKIPPSRSPGMNMLLTTR